MSNGGSHKAALSLSPTTPLAEDIAGKGKTPWLAQMGCMGKSLDPRESVSSYLKEDSDRPLRECQGRTAGQHVICSIVYGAEWGGLRAGAKL